MERDERKRGGEMERDERKRGEEMERDALERGWCEGDEGENRPL